MRTSLEESWWWRVKGRLMVTREKSMFELLQLSLFGSDG